MASYFLGYLILRTLSGPPLEIINAVSYICIRYTGLNPLLDETAKDPNIAICMFAMRYTARP